MQPSLVWWVRSELDSGVTEVTYTLTPWATVAVLGLVFLCTCVLVTLAATAAVEWWRDRPMRRDR